MMLKQILLRAAIALSALELAALAVHAQQAPAAVVIDPDDIGGVVVGPNGPEAGV